MLRSASIGGLCLAVVVSLTTVGVTKADTVAPGDVKIENLAVSSPLTAVPGDAGAGKKAFANRKQGNCLACHANSDMADQLFHGEVGPSLDGAGARWSKEMLRTIVVNAKAVFSDQTVMPGFYSLAVGEDVRKDLVGKTILTAQQVEDIVAYLVTLK